MDILDKLAEKAGEEGHSKKRKEGGLEAVPEYDHIRNFVPRARVRRRERGTQRRAPQPYSN